MTPEQIAAFAVFAFATSITPGPNNTMVIASGANFGLRATIPHLMGIDLGFAVMVIAVGAGLGGVFALYPVLHTVLKYCGAAYLIYLAWKIATAGEPRASGAAARPMTFLEAALFQWLNPKAWMSAIGAVATYTPAEGFFANLTIVALVFALVMAPCITLWAAVGTALRGVLTNPVYLRIFNVTLALLLVASLYPMLATAP